MNVLLLGSGGREHALALQIAKSPLLGQFFAAPGNPGIAEVGTCVALDPADATAVVDFCRVMDVGFVVVGPEAPLVAGLVDELAEAGIKAFGPRRAAAQLEGSKGFTKDLCTAFAIPTAAAAQFSDADTAKEYIRSRGAPIVVKADGLASGKGVVVAESITEAEAAVDQMLGGLFGAAGQTLVIEEFLDGEEISFFALCDGKTARAFASAQDHKRVGEGDTGPNTGGMGAYSPAPAMDDALSARVMDEIINPALRGMAQMGTPFVGVLFAGLMLTKDGPKLIEFNVRFGDPETQAILPRLQGDLLALLLACADGRLIRQSFSLSSQHALTIVLAADGYPCTPKKGTEIRGLDKAAALPGVVITQAGTKREGLHLLADGGRVLNVTGLGVTLAEARARAYAAVDAIDWPDGFCRRDIGWRALKGK
ncbi:MAG: phosphoribosylamine--glycine ligase [Methylovirgula sp.]|uniref:phosphoribosylamine--glycine ligase n=1 Tax=Methylovirgula sp. TaxID=1978224 RepID=UPI003075F508